jgi:hypothetical protein
MAIEDAYELAYREAVRALDHQLSTLTELRSRAGMLLAAASITLSLLGQETLHGTRPTAWAAIVCFALLSLCVLAIVWPHADWNFDTDPATLLDARLAVGRATVRDLSLELIAHMGWHRRANSRRLARVVRVFRVGASLLAIQIVLTIMAATAIV